MKIRNLNICPSQNSSLTKFISSSIVISSLITLINFNLFNPLSTSSLCPVGSVFLEPAFRNSPYEDSLLWSPPVDTVLFGFVVPFDSFEVVSVSGLPPGIDFSCLSTNCSWINTPPNQIEAYILLSGNPGTSTSGKYPLQVELKYYFTFFGVIQTLSETDTSLSIYLCPFENQDTQSEVQLYNTDDINLGNISTNGYYISKAAITVDGNMMGDQISLLSGNGSSLLPNFNLSTGTQLIVGSCPH